MAASLRASVSFRICLNLSSLSGYLMKISMAISAARAGSRPMVRRRAADAWLSDFHCESRSPSYVSAAHHRAGVGGPEFH
jgi:hypothetical protein